MTDGPAAPQAPGAGEVVWAEDQAGPLLRFSGRIDRDAVRRFRRLVPPSSWPARAELSGVSAIDAAGLELLVHLSRKPRRTGHDLELSGVPAHLHAALERAGLSGLVQRPDATPTSA